MLLSHCQDVAVLKYQWWNCRQNPFAELTQIYGSHDASLDIRNGLHAVGWFSGAAERRLLATMVQTQPSGWRIPSWTASGLLKWYHKSLSQTDSRNGPYQQYSKWWLQSQHRMDRPEIAHACQQSCLPPCKPLLLQQSSFEQVFLANMLLGPVALVLTSCNSCRSRWWSNSSKSLRLAAVTWWISRSNRSIALCRSASDHMVAVCWALFRRTWNCLCFGVVIFSALYSWTSIAARILWIFCSRKWWDSLGNWSSTVAFADFDIFWSRKAPFLLSNRFSASSSAARDRSEWFCWLTSRENSHNTRTAPITISSEAVSAAVFPASWEQSRIGAQFTASVLIMRRNCFPCQEPLFIESNGSGKCWRPGYHGTDVNRLSNWSLIFLAFRYLSSQCNKSLTKPRSSWCNSSGCQRR